RTTAVTAQKTRIAMPMLWLNLRAHRYKRTVRRHGDARLGSWRCFVWGRNRRLKASRSRRIAHGSSSRRSWRELSECSMPCLVGRDRLLGLWDQVVLDHPLALLDLGSK